MLLSAGITFLLLDVFCCLLVKTSKRPPFQTLTKFSEIASRMINLQSLRSIQIMLYLTLIAVNYPPASLIFFGSMMNLANFNLIDLTNFYNRVLHLDPNSVGNRPLNSQFELMGFDSLYFVQNFGLLLLVTFFPFLNGIFWSILNRFSDRRRDFFAS